MRLTLQKTLLRILGCQSQRSQSVHDKVEPQHLNRFQDLGLNESSPYKSANHSYNIDSQLELNKLSDRIENVSTPKDSLDD